MSQGARSAALMGVPKCGPSAALAAPRPSTMAMQVTRTAFSSVDMADLAPFIDAPACDGVEVLHRKCRNIRGTVRRTAFGDECVACRLHIAGLVRGAALQNYRP